MEKNYLDELLEVAEFFIESSKSFVNVDSEPTKDSKAWNELLIEPYKEYVANVLSFSTLLREVAFDYFMGITRVLEQPIMTFSPFVLFRGLIETSALSIWLTSCEINEIERTERWMKYRDKSLNQELLYLQSIGDIRKAEDISKKLELHRMNAERISLKTKNNMPSWTHIITSAHNAEGTYRLFSAITHNQHWALIASGFRVSETGVMVYENVRGGVLEKNMIPSAILFLFLLSIQYLSRMLCNQFSLFGWNSDEIKGIENNVVNRIKKISDNYQLIGTNGQSAS